MTIEDLYNSIRKELIEFCLRSKIEFLRTYGSIAEFPDRFNKSYYNNCELLIQKYTTLGGFVIADIYSHDLFVINHHIINKYTELKLQDEAENVITRFISFGIQQALHQSLANSKEEILEFILNANATEIEIFNSNIN